MFTVFTALEVEQKIREAARIAQQSFDLKLPLKMEELKSQFRRKAKEIHPDMTGTQDTGHAFDDLKKAFAALVALECLPGVFSLSNGNGYSYESIPQFTSDGTPLSKLGQGLGRTKNGRTCQQCDGRGYTEAIQHDWEPCPRCLGRGAVPKVYPCRACGGSGRYRLRNGRLTECLRCDGSGKFAHPFHEQLCLSCWGTGSSYTGVIKRVYHKCFRCNGHGQIPIFNPVIIKDALGACR